jgi:hypothetical protein
MISFHPKHPTHSINPSSDIPLASWSLRLHPQKNSSSAAADPATRDADDTIRAKGALPEEGVDFIRCLLIEIIRPVGVSNNNWYTL